MSAGAFAGAQAVCFCVLVVVTASLYFADGRRGTTDLLLLSASALLLAASALTISSQAYAWGGDDLHSRVSGAVAAALSAGAMVSMVVSVWRWDPPKGCGSHRAFLAAALIPAGLAVPVWIYTGEPSLFIVAEMLSLLILVSFYRTHTEADLKRRAEEIESRQAAIFQWQMRPHFLFNTLSTIRELMDRSPGLASAGLDDLAGYLRKNLDALTMDHMIPFTRELEHIEQYVSLEKLDPASRFEVVYDLQVIDFYLPALSVQPLVENAIRHGVRGMDDGGMVFVVTEQHGDMIRIIVEDNGPGFADGMTEQQKGHASRGLENVRRRLETQCGGSLHIHSREGRTRMIVLIPKRGLGT